MGTEKFATSSTSDHARDDSIGARFGITEDMSDEEKFDAFFQQHQDDLDIEPTPLDTKATTDLGEAAISGSARVDALDAVSESKEVVDHSRHDQFRRHARDLHGQGITAIRHVVKSTIERLAAKSPIIITVKLRESPGAVIPVHTGAQAKEPRKLSERQAFVKEQEDLWGANDKIEAEDVPEGELTYEQYLERRPKLQGHDAYHVGNRTFGLVEGTVRPIKRQTYENNLRVESKDDYYDKSNNEFHEKVADTIQQDLEGKAIVSKSKELSTLFALGNELAELKSSKTHPAQIEQKQRMFDDLKEFYASKGADERGVAYIERSLTSSVEAPVKGYATRSGEKVAITNVSEVEGEKTYDLAYDDGTETKEVAVRDIDFERERPDAKWSQFDKLKLRFAIERKKLQEFGGIAYFAAKFDQARQEVKGAGNAILNIGIEEDTSEEDKEKIRKRTRVILIAGGAALAIGSTIASIAYGVNHSNDSGLGVPDISPLGDVPSGPEHIGADTGVEAASDIGSLGGTDTGVENVPLTDIGTSAPEVPVASVPSAPESLVGTTSFDISSGQGGESLFTSLGIDPSKWYANEQQLANLFPNDFYRMPSGHVGIAHTGYLTQGAQEFINSLR